MQVTVKRIYNCSTYCISHVYIDSNYICDAIEDTDRMLDDSMTTEEIRKKKVYAQTAIPTGIYKMTLAYASPKFSKKEYYWNFCKGKLPRLENVKGFSGILWHIGTSANSSAGCLILGYNKIKGKVVDSKIAFEKVYNILKTAKDTITVKYIRTY